MSSTITLYEVGGCVRDRLLGVPSKDIDYAVETSSYPALRDWATSQGFTIFEERPDYLTLRARFPKTITADLATLVPPTEHLGRLTADFVLCRADGDYLDGRRPESVTPGTILDDLARRDFTVNAIARRADGSLLDPHDGQRDLSHRRLVAVGNAETRLREDSLRALRAIRFAVTKGFTFDEELQAALASDWMPAALASAHVNRRRDEMARAFAFDTPATFALLARFGPAFIGAVFADGLWLKPTLEQP